MMTTVYTAAIIGCGRIGTDFDNIESSNVFTHAKAYKLHSSVILGGVMDIDVDKARIASKKWECKAFSNIDELFCDLQPDIISICVPDEFHYEYLKICLEHHPKAVIVEKPLTVDYNSSEEIVNSYIEKNVPLFVNYSRRYDQTVQAFRERIVNQEFGKLYHATIKYTKGIMHNGSHAIDMANFLFGEYLSGKPINAIVDYREEDPTLSAILHYERCSLVFLLACDERAYSIFEVDVIGEDGRVIFDQSGFRYKEYAIRQDSSYSGYRELFKKELSNTTLKKALSNLVDNVVGHLERDVPILCSGKDGLVAQMISQNLIQSYNNTNENS
jgi:predicted dehydrogenase